MEEYHANAIAAFKEGDYETALENFLKANEAEPNPVTIFNIARCYEKLERYAEAYEFYKEYLATGEEVKAEDARDAMGRIEAMPSKLTVTTQPDDEVIEPAIEQLFDNLLLLEGLHPNPVQMVPRIQALLETATGK